MLRTQPEDFGEIRIQARIDAGESDDRDAPGETLHVHPGRSLTADKPMVPGYDFIE